MRNLFTLLFLCISFSVFSQNLSLEGDWLLAYISSSPPEMTIENGQTKLVYTEDSTQKTVLYVEPGTMLLSVLANGKAKSFYADVEENWKLVHEGKSVRFVSVADTLYGGLSANQFLDLQSTMDEVPTTYSFYQYRPSPMKVALENSTWQINSDSEILNGKTFEFRTNNQLYIWTDGQRKEEEYYLHALNNYYALEFTSPEMPAEFGMIYFETASEKEITGTVFIGYIGPDKSIPFKRHSVTFTRN